MATALAGIYISACTPIPAKVITADLLHAGSPNFDLVVEPAAGGAQLTSIVFPTTVINTLDTTATLATPLAVVVGNVGFRAGTISAITFSDPEYALDAASTCAVGTILSEGDVGATGTYCNIVIDFTPTQVGSISATMNISYTGPGGPFTITAYPLSGVGVLPAIANLKLWLDANDLTTLFQTSDCTTTAVTTNAQTVGCWKDKSGNNFNATQATGGDRPTYSTNQVNTKPVLSFNGTTDFLSVGTNLGKPANFSVFVVAQTTTIAGRGAVLGSSDGGGTDQSIWGTFIVSQSAQPAGSLWMLASDGTHALGGSTQNVIAATTYYMMEQVYTAGQTNIAATISKVSSTVNVTDVGASRNDLGAVNPFLIGNIPFSCHFSGTIAEVLIYNSALNASDRQSVEAYFHAKYNL